MAEIFALNTHGSHLPNGIQWPLTSKSVLLKRLVLGISAGLLAVMSGCGGDSSSGVVSVVPGATGQVSSIDPAGVAAATSQSVPNARMQAVLDQLAALGAKPVETLSAAQARAQPGPADAV